MPEPAITDPSAATHQIVDPSSIIDPVFAKEQAAFATYVRDQGQQIPANFKSADEWFASLKTAQSQYTKGQQELSNLKKQYNQNGITNPAYKEPVVAGAPIVPAAKPDLSGMPDELKIADIVPITQAPSNVSQADWVKWGAEVDKNGTMSQATRNEIKTKMGADDVVIDQMIRGASALRKETFNATAAHVGGPEQLKTILKWAQESLGKEEVASLNQALQTTAAPSVLMGLQSRMAASTPKPPVNQEPKVVLDRVNNSQVPGQVQVFNNVQQQNAAVRDPRYRTDPSFRQAVEQMMVNSAQHGFKGH